MTGRKAPHDLVRGLETIEEHAERLPGSDVADDAAHGEGILSARMAIRKGPAKLEELMTVNNPCGPDHMGA